FRDTNGDSTPDLLVINWFNAHYFGGQGSGDNGITFQAVLRLNTGAAAGFMVFNYTDLDDGGVATTQNLGVSATVGIKNADTPGPGDPLQQYFNNTPPIPAAPFGQKIFKNGAPVAAAN